MSVNGLQQQYIPPTLDGLNIIEADQIYIDGELVDLDNLVPYTNATKILDMGSLPVRSSSVPTTGNDLINFSTLVSAISNQDITNQTTFLDKITTTPQTVVSNTTYLNGLSVSDSRPANLSSKVEVDANYQSLTTSANVTVGQDFGTISNVGTTYQATSTNTASPPILILFPITVGQRYTLQIEVLGDDAVYDTTLDIYQSQDGVFPFPNFIDAVLDSPLFAPASTVFHQTNATFVATTTGFVVLSLTTSNPSGISTVKWRNLSTYEMGVSLTNATMPAQIADRVMVLNDRKQLVASGINTTKLGYLDNVSSDIQTQLNDKASLTQSNTFTGDNQFQQGTTTTTGITSFKNNSNAQANVGYELAFSNQSTTTKRLGRISLLRNTTGTSDYSSKMGLDVSTDGAIYKRMLTLHPTDGISAGANRIQTSYVPALGDDVLNKTYGDATYATTSALGTYLPLTGGTLTGDLSQTATKMVSFSGGTLKTQWVPLGFTASSFQAIAIPVTSILLGTISNPPTGWRLTPASGEANSAMNLPGFTYRPGETYQYLITGIKSSLSFGDFGVFQYDSGGFIVPPVVYEVFTTPTNITGTFTIPPSGGSTAFIFSGAFVNQWVEWASFTLSRTDVSIIGGATITGNVGIGTTPSGSLLSLYSTTAARETGIVLRSFQASLTLDTISGRRWNIWSTETSNAVGSGCLAMYDNTAAAYRFLIDTAGNVGINTTGPLGNLHVRLPQAVNDTWGNFVVKTTSWWGDGCSTRSETAGTQYATMYRMMFQGPHIVSDADGWCPLRMGRAGGVTTGKWWEVATRADGWFQIGVERSNQLSINPNGAVNIVGGTPYAVPNNYMAAGSLTIGATDKNYGFGSVWNTNTAGLLLECQAFTEIAIHDTGDRIASVVAYNSNTMIFGRDMGYGVIGKFDFRSRMEINAGDNSYITHGPNTSWGSYLYVGATTTKVTNFNIAQVITTNGNLHLDCGASRAMYYGYYTNLLGYPPTHYFHGTAMYFNGTIFVSDEREKEDIQPLKTTSSLKRVLALRPAHYRRRYCAETPDHIKQERCIGFVAQEVQQSNAHTVKEWNKAVSTEEDPNPEPDMRLGIDYNDYIVHLCGAVQEVVKQLDEQRKRVETLEARNQVLEAHAREQEKEKAERLATMEAREEIMVKEFAEYKRITDERFDKIAQLLSTLK